MFKKEPDNEGFVYTAPTPMKSETREIEKACARLFSSDDGRKVLGYLQTVTFQRALNAECSDAQLRYAEGQRSLVASILRMIERGRTNVN